MIRATGIAIGALSTSDDKRFLSRHHRRRRRRRHRQAHPRRCRYRDPRRREFVNTWGLICRS